jgi:hypothetical protein
LQHLLRDCNICNKFATNTNSEPNHLILKVRMRPSDPILCCARLSKNGNLKALNGMRVTEMTLLWLLTSLLRIRAPKAPNCDRRFPTAVGTVHSSDSPSELVCGPFYCREHRLTQSSYRRPDSRFQKTDLHLNCLWQALRLCWTKDHRFEEVLFGLKFAA